MNFIFWSSLCYKILTDRATCGEQELLFLNSKTVERPVTLHVLYTRVKSNAPARERFLLTIVFIGPCHSCLVHFVNSVSYESFFAIELGPKAINIHSYNTRNSRVNRLPYCRTNTKKFSPFFQGPTKFCNSLDNEVINSQSLSSFKKILKIKLLRKYENRA